MKIKRVLIICTTDSMIWNFLVPHIKQMELQGLSIECACSRTGFYYDELIEKHNLCLHEIKFARSPFKMQNLKAYYDLKDLIKKGNFDMIHCHEPVGGALGRLAGKRNRKYVLYIAHGFHFFEGASLKHWILYFSFEYILSLFTDCIVTVCREDYSRAKKFFAKSCYYITGIGVEFQNYDIKNKVEVRKEVRKELDVSQEDILLITVGELSARKNQCVILRAMHKMKNPNIKLIICGEGEKQKELEKLVKKYGLEKQVKFLGFRKDIPRILYAGDIFVFPSLWEGLGLAGIEAMYCKLPVIGSARQGILDYVIDNKTGLLFEPTDEVQLAEKIKYLAENEELRKKMGNVGHKFVMKYSLSNSLLELERIYIRENILIDKEH